MTFLGVMIDDSLLFKKHMKTAASKVWKVSAALSQLILNV